MRINIKNIFITFVIILLIPFSVFAGLDEDLNKNLNNKTKCIKSWYYNNSSFNINFDSNECKDQEASAVILTVRYIFESNNAKFPKKVVLNFGNGKVESYPFTNIRSLIKK